MGAGNGEGKGEEGGAICLLASSFCLYANQSQSQSQSQSETGS